MVAAGRAASAIGRGWTSRHPTGAGAIAAIRKGPDPDGTDRMAPGLTHCHECHDFGPRSSPLQGDVKHVFLFDPILLFDPSIERSLRLASYCPRGDMKLVLSPIESTPNYRGANVEKKPNIAQAFPSSMGTNTGRVEMYRRWPRDEARLARWIGPAMSTMIQAIPHSGGRLPRRPRMESLKPMSRCAYFLFQ